MNPKYVFYFFFKCRSVTFETNVSIEAFTLIDINSFNPIYFHFTSAN